MAVRVASLADIDVCGRSTVKSVKWSLDGLPLPVGVYWDQGYAITDELGAWSASTKQLCVDVGKLCGCHCHEHMHTCYRRHRVDLKALLTIECTHTVDL